MTESKIIPLSDADFVTGGLQLLSYARPGKLFTASEALFSGSAGILLDATLNQVRETVAALVKGELVSPE
ncbi:MAG: hypothetical protein ACOY15_09760 [Pseudomonadota bacterium]